MQEQSFYFAFSNFSGVGPVKFNKLIKHFGSAQKAWKSDLSEFEVIAGKSLTSKFETFRKEFDINENLKTLKKLKIELITNIDKEYPSLLKKIPNAPIALYVKGNKKFLNSQDNKMIAVVGARKITSYGWVITEMFAGDLARAGFVIVSGMAFGVDGIAHKAAINVKGKTVAVLGNGVDLPYPRENQRLYEEILDSGGAIISEYPPGEPPSIGSFPARNRIVAGISEAVLVTEGASDSGSLITANFGLEFGRKVFAVPGPITSSLSAAPLKLIEKGAKLVVTPEDMIKDLGVSRLYIDISNKKQKYVGLCKEEKKIIELIENEPLSFDEIVRRIKLDSSKIGSLLSMMEIKGIIKNSGGRYSVNL
jgi:DNA processing protein